MKLRIRGNSLRLRLLRGEVEQFGKTGRITETIRFGTSAATQLSYVLEADGEARQISAKFSDNKVTVMIPDQMARTWIESGQVSLMSDQPIENGEQNGTSESVLKILIEKDFVCLDREDDPDNIDAFPHPTGKCG